jgi:hypothetical protein
MQRDNNTARTPATQDSQRDPPPRSAESTRWMRPPPPQGPVTFIEGQSLAQYYAAYPPLTRGAPATYSSQPAYSHAEASRDRGHYSGWTPYPEYQSCRASRDYAQLSRPESYYMYNDYYSQDYYDYDQQWYSTRQ